MDYEKDERDMPDEPDKPYLNNRPERKYCYRCRHWAVSMRNKPCNTCIPTKTEGKKIIDTYERLNYEAEEPE